MTMAPTAGSCRWLAAVPSRCSHRPSLRRPRNTAVTVAREALDGDGLASAPDEAGADLQGHPPAVLGQDLELVRAGLGVAGDLAADHLPRALEVLGRHHLSDVEAERFRAAVAGDPLPRAVQGGEVPGQVVRVHDLVG